MTSVLNLNPETRVNTYTHDDQYAPAVAVLANGDYVVVWDSYGHDGDGDGIYGQIYHSDGSRSGQEFIVNTTTVSSQRAPDVAALDTGGFVIVWTGNGVGDTNDVFARTYMPGFSFGPDTIYTADGDEFKADSAGSSVTNATDAHVAALAGGGYVVSWVTDQHITYQIVDESNSPLPVTYFDGSSAISGVWGSDVTGLSDGSFVIVWTDDTADGDGKSVQVLHKTLDGSFYHVFTANTTTDQAQQDAAVTALADGGYVVVWDGNGPGDDQGIFLQRYDASDNPVGGETRVNTTTAAGQYQPDVATLADGGFVVTWHSGPDASTQTVLSQRFDDLGHAIGGETQISSHPGAAVSAVAGLQDGGMAVVWQNSTGQDGAGYGVYSRVLHDAPTLTGTQYLYGTSDADVLDGGSGNDQMYGGFGDDIYYVNSTSDGVHENANEGYDTIITTANTNGSPLAANVENVVLAGSSPISFFGNELNNVMTGNGNANAILGLDGNDIIDGGGGDDNLNGGNNDDYIDGGAGNDTIYGSFGSDTLYGGDGNDTIDAGSNIYDPSSVDWADGGAGDDNITGGFGPMFATGDGGNDTITGGDGDDTLDGGDGNDVLNGGGSSSRGNVLDGGAGSDTLIYGGGISFVSGGDGFDTYVMSSYAGGLDTVINLSSGTAYLVEDGGPYTVASLDSIEAVYGSVGKDTIIGNAANNSLVGDNGNDTIDGGAGDDQLDGGGGADTLSYASATSAVTVSLALQGQYQDTGGAGSDITYGFENLTGSKYADTLTGDGNANVLDGGKGNDTLYGGGGNDTYIVDSTTDVASEQQVVGVDDGGTDLVMSSVDFTLAAFLENLTLTGINNRNGTGNQLANILTGNDGHNTLKGLGGADYLDGGASSDTMYGGAGDDTYVVDVGTDTVREDTVSGVDDGGHDKVISSITYVLTAFVEDLDLTGSAVNGSGNELDNHLTGNAGDNSLLGYGGNDVLDGGQGADRMYGGAGNDTYYVDDAGDKTIEDKTSGVDDGGTDLVISSISLTLGNFVENLTLTGTANAGGAGNTLNNVIVGNSGGNILTGNGGNDTLIGGLGHDTFSFSAAAANGLDHLTDFVSGTDHLRFKGSDYGFATGHVLTSAELQINATGAASGGTHQFIYNTTTHTLYWDSDGTGATAAIAIAVFDNVATPATGDFIFT